MTPSPPLRDALLTFVVCAAVYALLMQSTLYRGDGHHLLERFRDADFTADRHFLTLPLMWGFRALLGLVGEVSMYQAATWLAALMSALGMALTLLGCTTLGIGRQRATLVTGLLATALPVVLFATVVEFHGVFLAFSQGVFWIQARFVRRQTVGLAMALGAGAAIAGMVHSTGDFLSLLSACWFLAWTRGDHQRSRWARWGLVLVIAATHIAGKLAITAVLQGIGIWSGAGLQLDVAPEVLRAQAVARVLSGPRVFWEEFVLPYLPMSAAFFMAAFTPGLRARFWAVMLGMTPYVGIMMALGVNTEYGAYFPPVATLVAVVVVHLVSARLAVAMIIVNLIVSVGFVIRSDTEGARYAEFVAGVRELSAARDAAPSVLVVARHWDLPSTDIDELGAILSRDPGLHFVHLSYLARSEPRHVEPGLHLLGDYVAQRARGDLLLLANASLARMTRPEDCRAGDLIERQLRAAYRFEPVSRRGFCGFVLHRRR